ncbi:MAG TPA: ABC transporter [Gammaproteobacteria bacterium]|jgi:phospholipid-binding lipoprotein MlaA|uniref:Nucleoside ABC transporter, periplasmic nucleoside-binding protein n=1 Tax=hydrothermal vent metagenome TaxID=652676 RepID=A0A1W1DXW6_9ZZZZ|nr:ABC transporter [Gammaproteobacteria bacterium]HAO38866.1 ABC transporter [Gammaproteobacteria bacterium]HAO90573.1 ABC transporter [Gammaproteobacteria bacterium]HCA68154.1 ABC transporter [Gammaproteobacteria bacterium]HCJ78277.1 ABC transporter [Gammaproteobacteria bacterium]
MKQLLMSFLLFFMANTLAFAEEDVDPFEDINRTVYGFNETVDDNLLEPVSRAYKDHVPEVAQDGVSNFFGNLRDVSTLANQILQFKPVESIETLGRILVNSTIGLGGLFDVASDMGLTTDDEDFGQTMGVWGVEEGPYVVLPLLGPSTVRDGAGLFVDTTSDANMIDKTEGIGFISSSAINIIDKRVELLPVTDMLDLSDDPYTMMRSSYLQKRKFDVFDGNLPVEEDEFDDF